jgi:hypothetical protein
LRNPLFPTRIAFYKAVLKPPHSTRWRDFPRASKFREAFGLRRVHAALRIRVHTCSSVVNILSFRTALIIFADFSDSDA